MPFHKNVSVRHCQFFNNSYRSVKTQAERTQVLSCTFANDQILKHVSGNTINAPEVDIQRGCAHVSGNQFLYPTEQYTASVLIAVRSWESNEGASHSHLVTDNQVDIENKRLRGFVGIASNKGKDLVGCVVSNNTINAVCETFATIKTSSTSTQYRVNGIFNDNVVMGLGRAFAYLYREGDAELGSEIYRDPIDPGTRAFFNLSFLNNKSMELGDSQRQFSVHTNPLYGSNIAVNLGLNSNEGFAHKESLMEHPIAIL